MHWPRIGKPPASSSPAQPVASTSAPASSSSNSKGGKEEKDPSEGWFDPTNLEKGSTALKEIDKSKNAPWAFELAALQEKTKQLEHLKEVERQRTGTMEIEDHFASAQTEEACKTISHMADEERQTSQFKAQVEHELQHRKLEFQKDLLDYRLKREQEQFMQHEQFRVQNEKELEEAARQTIRLKCDHDRDTAVAEAQAAASGAAQQERDNIEIRIREMRAKSAEERSTRLQAIEETLSGLASGARALQEDPSKMVTAVAGFTCLAFGVYGARAATRVVATVLEKRLGRPPLVRETSRWTWRPNMSWLALGSKEKPNIFENIVLEEELAGRLQWTTNALLNAQQNGTPYRHLLLHGPPGTGKTLFARTLARQSGLDYAVMSGGDLGPLGKEGPNELHKLFGWANNSKRGLVLFIDEADAFLRRGRGKEAAMSEDARNALSVFLHHTGTESARVSVILATNVPGALDRAVLDRMDEAFEFPLPAESERITMLQMFMQQYIHKPTKKGKGIEVDESINEEFIKAVAGQTKDFSGRQLAKLVLALQAAVFGSGSQKLTKGLADAVLAWRLQHPNA